MLPNTFKPMLASMAEPFDSPDFTYEIKWDGYRCLAFLSDETRLLSRNQKDITAIFPELRNIHQKVTHPGCLLDGEIIALRNSRPSFLQLQKRAQLKNEQQIRAAMRSIPVVYVVFDLLYLNHEPIFNLPIEERRHFLVNNLNDMDELILARYIDQDGVAFFNSVSQLNLEGVIAKQKGSSYLPGKRVKTWLKFKHKQRGNFVVCGFSTNPATREQLSSLILGAYYQKQLKMIGMVGTGFTVKELETIHRELQKISSPVCPFTGTVIRQKNVEWVKPLIVCEVEYLEQTDAGGLRHPSFKRFRPDLTPADCNLAD